MRCILIAIFLSLGLMKAQSSNVITHVTLTCYQPVKSQCDKEPLVTSDGSIDYYSYEVHNLPVGIEKFSYGDFIKLEILGAEEVIMKVKGFHRYQLQCKIWA